MKQLFTLYRDEYLFTYHHVISRNACRAIIQKDNKFLLIQSKKYTEYKFPGGGMKQEESHKETLAREVMEETGFEINHEVFPIGITIEYGLDYKTKTNLFLQTSYYYRVTIINNQKTPRYEGYEVEYGYQPVWVGLEEALKHNETIACISQIPWIKRDTEMIKQLLGGEIEGEN